MFTTWMQNVNVNQYKTECKQHLPTYAKNNNKGKATKFYWTLVLEDEKQNVQFLTDLLLWLR